MPEGHVTAFLVDEDTLDVDGVLFVRKNDAKGEGKAMLMPVDGGIAPHLRCTNCGYERAYFFWYRATAYAERIVNHCPGCGHRILGTMGQPGS